MPRFSCSLSDEQNDWLEAEADRRDRSKADVVRQCIDMVRTGEHQTEPVNTESHRSGEIAELRDRVDDLEDRLADIEDQPDPEPIDDSGAPDPRPEPPVSGAEDAVDKAIEGWRPGRGPDERARHHDSARAVFEWLRDRPEPATASEIKAALYEEVGIDGQKERTWWETSVLPAMNHAIEQGVVERTGREYRWLGVS